MTPYANHIWSEGKCNYYSVHIALVGWGRGQSSINTACALLIAYHSAWVCIDKSHLHNTSGNQWSSPAQPGEVVTCPKKNLETWNCPGLAQHFLHIKPSRLQTNLSASQFKCIPITHNSKIRDKKQIKQLINNYGSVGSLLCSRQWTRKYQDQRSHAYLISSSPDNWSWVPWKSCCWTLAVKRS